jgi:hypothetical protein
VLMGRSKKACFCVLCSGRLVDHRTWSIHAKSAQNLTIPRAVKVGHPTSGSRNLEVKLHSQDDHEDNTPYHEHGAGVYPHDTERSETEDSISRYYLLLYYTIISYNNIIVYYNTTFLVYVGRRVARAVRKAAAPRPGPRWESKIRRHRVLNHQACIHPCSTTRPSPCW